MTTNNKENDDYFDSFSFLQSDEKEESKSKPNVTQNKNVNVITLDKLNNNIPDINKAVHAIMTEKPAEVDYTFMPKSQERQTLESPELNKKLRTQIQYNQMMSESPIDKKLIQNKDISDILFKDEFDVNKFKSDAEKKKILITEFNKILQMNNMNSQSKNSEEKRKKVYRIKKKIMNESTTEPSTRINKTDLNWKYIYIPFMFSISMLFFLTLFRKKYLPTTKK